jgi:hypothetical protein
MTAHLAIPALGFREVSWVAGPHGQPRKFFYDAGKFHHRAHGGSRGPESLYLGLCPFGGPLACISALTV